MSSYHITWINDYGTWKERRSSGLIPKQDVAGYLENIKNQRYPGSRIRIFKSVEVTDQFFSPEKSTTEER